MNGSPWLDIPSADPSLRAAKALSQNDFRHLNWLFSSPVYVNVPFVTRCPMRCKLRYVSIFTVMKVRLEAGACGACHQTLPGRVIYSLTVVCTPVVRHRYHTNRGVRATDVSE